MLIFPELAPTSSVYFDVNNGTTKCEWKILGVVYKTRIDETDYSKFRHRRVCLRPRHSGNWRLE
jgi:hypothetical protein